MRVICVSFLLLWLGILLADIYDVGYNGSFENIQMQQFMPSYLGLVSEDYKAIGEWAKRTGCFVYESKINQLNFFKIRAENNKGIYKYLYSNSPESLDKEQLIYFAKNITEPFKLLYFHKNISGSDGYLQLSIRTKSEFSTLLISGGLVNSLSSEMWAGQIIAERYWQTLGKEMLWQGSWNSSYLIKNLQVAGGVIDVYPQNQVSYDIIIRFVATDAWAEIEDEEYRSQDYPIYDYENIREKLIIDNPSQIYNMFVGNNKFLNKDKNTLYGNYGVIYEYEAIIKMAGEYECFYTCNGGPARYALKIDNKYYSGYCNNSSTAITTLNLEYPKSIVLKTIPLPGSNYPTTITIKKKK